MLKIRRDKIVVGETMMTSKLAENLDDFFFFEVETVSKSLLLITDYKVQHSKIQNCC